MPGRCALFRLLVFNMVESFPYSRVKVGNDGRVITPSSEFLVFLSSGVVTLGRTYRSGL